MTSHPVLPMRRRALLAASALLAGGLARAGQTGNVSLWMPYSLSEIKVVLPTLSAAADADNVPGAARRALEHKFQPTAADAALSPSTQSRRRTPAVRTLRRPPTAYVLTGQRMGVPPWILFGVALQESQLVFGDQAVPFPWTLCVRGRGERHNSYTAVRDALAAYLRSGITNIDCGVMQVNWKHHSDKLLDAGRALDPHLNLAIGAQILHENFAAVGNWPLAVGLYHVGSIQDADRRRRAADYAAGVERRLSRYGVNLAQAAKQEAIHG